MKKIMFLIAAFVLISGTAHAQGGERGGFFGLWGGYNRYPPGYHHAYGWKQPMVYSGVNYTNGVSFYSAGSLYYSSVPAIYSAPSSVYFAPVVSIIQCPCGICLYP